MYIVLTQQQVGGRYAFQPKFSDSVMLQMQTRKEIAIDSARLISQAMSNLISNNRADLYRQVYKEGQIYNGNMFGVPCHIYDNPWIKGKFIMQALKKVRS